MMMLIVMVIVKLKMMSKEILKEIEKYLDLNPDLTFNQALIHLGITNEFQSEGDGYEYRFEIIDYNEKPEEQLRRIKINKYITNEAN